MTDSEAVSQSWYPAFLSLLNQYGGDFEALARANDATSGNLLNITSHSIAGTPYADYDKAASDWIGGKIAAEQASRDSGGFGGLGGLFSNPLSLVTAPAAFMVGGTSGASLATGNGITPQTLGLDAAGLAAGAGLSAALAPSAAAGGTASGVGGAVGSGGEDLGGGGMWDWLDQIDGGDTFTVNPSISDLGGNIDPVTGFPVDTGSAAAGGSSIWDTILNKGLNYAQNAITNKLNGGGGSVLDTITNNPLQAGINFTPFLLSAYLANQQRGDLDGVLNQINPDAYQSSVLNPYDLQTSQARAALQNDMGLRGVAGSSFGNQQLNNFDYMHGIERGDLASKAALASAGLQGQLINQRNLNSNLLLGSGLNATAKLFQPQPVVALPGVSQPQPAPQPKPLGDNLLGDLFNLGKSALGSGGYFGGLFGNG